MEGLILRDGGRFTTPYTLHTCLLAATLARLGGSDPCLRTAGTALATTDGWVLLVGTRTATESTTEEFL